MNTTEAGTLLSRLQVDLDSNTDGVRRRLTASGEYLIRLKKSSTQNLDPGTWSITI